MPATELTPNYPQRIRFSTEQSELYYERSPAYALHYSQPDSAPPEADRVLEDGTIAIVSEAIARSHQAPNVQITPVYTLAPGKAVAVPTGRVFVQFSKNTIASEQEPTLQQAGYTIEFSPPYAPHTAWVQAQSGNIAEALSNIPNLEAIPGVENVEPQMLMERQWKTEGKM